MNTTFETFGITPAKLVDVLQCIEVANTLYRRIKEAAFGFHFMRKKTHMLEILEWFGRTPFT